MPHTDQPTATAPLSSDPLADVVPFLTLPKLHPNLFGAKNSAQWLLRQRESNGLAEHLRWVGRTAFISRGDFAAWFRSRSQPAPRTEAQRVASARNVVVARKAKTKSDRRAAV